MKYRKWECLAHNKSFSSGSVQDSAENQEGKGKTSLMPFTLGIVLTASMQTLYLYSVHTEVRQCLSESMRGEGDGELAVHQGCVTVKMAQDHKPTGLSGLWGQGWAIAHDALGAPQKEVQRVSCLPWSKEGPWRAFVEASGLWTRRRRCPEVGTPGDSLIQTGCAPTHAATPVPHRRCDELIMTPFLSQCDAPSSPSQCRKLTCEGKSACFSRSS